ncbi:MAG: hypothetical protein MJ093_05985 [Saccharofermentans sp.]|nr:hypothetical protein [Saccharofermentans sp.]
MVVEGRLYSANKIMAIKTCEYSNEKLSFSQELGEALVLLCKNMEISVPLWLSKNTHEFAQFHSTNFNPDQFNESVSFDRFQFKMLK